MCGGHYRMGQGCSWVGLKAEGPLAYWVAIQGAGADWRRAWFHPAWLLSQVGWCCVVCVCMGGYWWRGHTISQATRPATPLQLTAHYTPSRFPCPGPVSCEDQARQEIWGQNLLRFMACNKLRPRDPLNDGQAYLIGNAQPPRDWLETGLWGVGLGRGGQGWHPPQIAGPDTPRWPIITQSPLT